MKCLPNQGTPLDSVVYEWDAVGNPEHLGAVVDSANLLIEFDGFVMTYDDDHNMLSKIASGDTTTFTWNSLGQLTEVTKNGTTTSYTCRIADVCAVEPPTRTHSRGRNAGGGVLAPADHVGKSWIYCGPDRVRCGLLPPS